MILTACKCEHEAHFDRKKRTPDGNPTHKYGMRYAMSYLRRVQTPYGIFTVCRDCAEDCYAFTVWPGWDES